MRYDFVGKREFLLFPSEAAGSRVAVHGAERLFSLVNFSFLPHGWASTADSDNILGEKKERHRKTETERPLCISIMPFVLLSNELLLRRQTQLSQSTQNHPPTDPRLPSTSSFACKWKHQMTKVHFKVSHIRIRCNAACASLCATIKMGPFGGFFLSVPLPSAQITSFLEADINRAAALMWTAECRVFFFPSQNIAASNQNSVVTVYWLVGLKYCPTKVCLETGWCGLKTPCEQNTDTP